MLRSLRTAILLSFLALLGCKGVQPNDLVGTWVMEDSSRNLLPNELKNALAAIVLNGDGTFKAAEMPEETMPKPPYDAKQRNLRLDSGRGDWKLVAREGKQQVQLNFVTLQGGINVPYGTQMNVSSGWSTTLYYFLGDPDEGRRVSFARK